MSTTDDSSPVAEFAVRLGSGTLADGSASETTLLRAQKALDFSRENPQAMLILSGDGHKALDAAASASHKTEAAVMSEILLKGGVVPSSILLEDESIDTIGNAVLSVVRYLADKPPGKVYLITSPFHMLRATLCFAGALSADWVIVPTPCAVASDDAARGANESGGIGWVQRFYNGITPGDTEAVKARLLSVGKAHYGTIARLKPTSKPAKVQTPPVESEAVENLPTGITPS